MTFIFTSQSRYFVWNLFEPAHHGLIFRVEQLVLFGRQYLETQGPAETAKEQ